ncbi:SPOR domain-containing protein [Anaeromyxobacter sp. Fw109-5]|uniref:SPOR domain-containing protein n=1 Tax=Anaeromyxobacter sp. (strain Fw109-5) TaxID=404589 RepID=UPI0000ED7577|nr:SPOR domain-containing protein [Anaeromyxobacter sp. Fw109-5]ABS26489.1 Sporulation domain protein [Anaeromyxobacter sp. Fw109-5]
MRDDNSRVREKFDLSLDGRQIASIVVGALVILGVVFVLGLNVGRQIATRQADVARAGDLEALDRAPSAAAPAVDGASLTFHDSLVKEKAPPMPAVATPSRTAPPPAVPAALPAPAPSAAPTVAAPAKAAPASAERAEPATAGAFTIQIGASQQRAEADRIAARHRSLRPRVEAAEVDGKGRWYRVRVGSFDTREAAERYRRDVARETGVAGYVTASR